jgi:polysaccharide export outer membrane protein
MSTISINGKRSKILKAIESLLVRKCLVWTAAITAMCFLAADVSAQVVPASGLVNRYPHAGAVHTNGCDCHSCMSLSNSHDPMLVPQPDQSTGVTSGACHPCYRGIDCATSGGIEQRWKDVGPLNLDPLRHGEYIGPVRLPSMLDYRARVGDEFQFIYVLTRERIGDDYRLMVGDQIMVESVTDPEIRRGDFAKGLEVQADGNVSLRLIGPVQAAGKSIQQLRKDIEKAYSLYLKSPSIDVTPIKTNTALEDLRQAVSNFLGNNGGQNITAVVNPDGKVQLPLVGSVYVVGMSPDEIRREVNLRYRERIIGIELEPRLIRQASHFVYVFGQVNKPGRFEISQPTTVTQALAMAEGLQVGGNNRQIVVFRRAEDWRLVSTMLDLRGAHLGKRPNPADEIWLRDNDLIIVPPRPIKVFNDFVRQVFTDGLYPMIPPALNISSTGDVSLSSNN